MADFTEIMNIEDQRTQMYDIVNDMNNSSSMMYCSFDPSTPEEKKLLFNAVSAQTEQLIDQNGKTIKIRDCVIVPTKVNGDKGEAVVPRTVIIDCEGKTYSACSWGVYHALSRLVAIMGTLHFYDGLEVKIEKVKTAKGNTINIKLV